MAALSALALLAGCGDEDERASPTPPAPPPVVEPVPYDGSLPGRELDLGPQAGYLGVVRKSVRRVLGVGLGPERLGLLVGLDRRDRSLCVGYRLRPEPRFVDVDFRCFGPGAAPPVIAFVARSGTELGAVDRATVFGIAQRPVRKVVVLFAGDRRRTARTHVLAGTDLFSFVLEVARPPFPRAVRALGPAGGAVAELSLAPLLEPPCAEPCPGLAGPWLDVVDAG